MSAFCFQDARVSERTSGLGSGKGTTPGWALASQNASPFVADLLVRAEEVADLASSGSNVAYRKGGCGCQEYGG